MLELAGKEHFSTEFLDGLRKVRLSTSSCQVYLGIKPGEKLPFIGDLLFTSNYPEFDKNPVALFMLATFVYDEQLHDLDKAREAYQQIIDNYPENPFANDAAIAITQLGMTPEELIRMFESQENTEGGSQE